MNAVRVPWSSASFLVYLGGFVIFGAILSLLQVQSEDHGAPGLVLWAVLVLAVLAALAFLSRRTGHFVTAGLLALSSVGAFVVAFGALLDWFGWLPDIQSPGFRGFHFWLLVLELATVIAAAVALSIFRFPLLVFVLAATSWYFTTDLLSGGGNWSAWVTIAFGLVLLAAGAAVDTGPSRPYGFWLHVVSGLTIGGALLWFFHDSDFDWILIAIAALLYIALGDRLMRSSWVVLGAWGFLQTTSHFAEKWSDGGLLVPLFYLFPFTALSASDGGPIYERHRPWAAPLMFAVVGFLFIGIALFLARRRREAIPAAELL
jgi:MYXO-CTERM domain-containing protein